MKERKIKKDSKRTRKEKLNKHRKDKKTKTIVNRKYRTIEKSSTIPLVSGKYEWNTYNVENRILHHDAEDGHHTTLVLLEYKGKLLLAEITHSSRGGRKLQITNPVSTDTEESFIKRITVVSLNQRKTVPIRISHLGIKRNDRYFSKEEKEKILKSLNNKKVNIDNLKLLIRL